MNIRGAGGIRVQPGNNRVIITPDERVLSVVSGVVKARSTDYSHLYFYASISDNGEDVNVAPGLLILPDLALAGPISIDAFAVNGFTPSTSGFIIYEATLVENDGPIEFNSDEQSVPVHIGTTDYAFSVQAHADGTNLDPLFVEGTMYYSTSGPVYAPGFFRAVIATVDIDSLGFPGNLQQKHIGALLFSQAETFYTDNAAVFPA